MQLRDSAAHSCFAASAGQTPQRSHSAVNIRIQYTGIHSFIRCSCVLRLHWNLSEDRNLQRCRDLIDMAFPEYLYLFAADKSENSDIKKLVRYYKDALKFYECEEDDIIIIKPEYDKYCYGLVEEISKLAENRETIWEEFSDI